MANLKIPNLCGASPEFNSIQNKFESLITSAVDGLDSSPSSLSSTIGTDITSLETELRALVPELPALPNVNLPSQLTSLSSLTPGSFGHTQLLADITTKFGTELAASGFSLDTLVTNALSAIQGGGDLCSAVPNFELPADGSSAAAEKAVESKQATIDSAEEKTSTVVKNLPWLEEQKENETRVASMQVEGESEDADVVKGTITSTTPPTENTGAYKVTDESSKVTYDGNAIEVTTPATQDGKNISTKGLAKRKAKITEYFKLTSAAVEQLQNKAWLVELKHIPIPSSVRVIANFVRVGKVTKELDDGNWETIEDVEHQNFYAVPQKWAGGTMHSGEKPVTSLSSRTKSFFYVGDNKTDPPDLVIILPIGEVFKPHTKDHPSAAIGYFDGPEYEGILFKVRYSYFENYDPGLVET